MISGQPSCQAATRIPIFALLLHRLAAACHQTVLKHAHTSRCGAEPGGRFEAHCRKPVYATHSKVELSTPHCKEVVAPHTLPVAVLQPVMMKRHQCNNIAITVGRLK